MVEFQESKTKENLARSFAAECQEGARYQFLSKMAMKQGYQYLSTLIRTLAHHEMSHAQQFFNKIGEYGGQETQNIDIHAGYPFKSGELVDTIFGESQNEKNAGENIYPGFANIARDEGYDDVADLFEMIAKVELSHEKTLEQLYAMMKAKKLYKSSSPKAFKCDSCGYVADAKSAPKVCPLCKMEQGYFRIDVNIDDYKDLEDKYCPCVDDDKAPNCGCNPQK